ncbi:protein PET100 homolog, mitochondrial isoform X1 [Petaurus breviceps papuanus]|uniref:protein PET100 homolog, mitochondrial isoform X1 n=1 Tax=Petaurus breviceps papuanus TaxID=3040969 RepID=UPI0036DEAE33
MGVKLEVFRVSAGDQGRVGHCFSGPGWGQMMLYLTFPVAMFWVSNQAEYFEEYVVQRKREIFPPEREDQRQELEDFKERMRKQREERLLRTAQQ